MVLSTIHTSHHGPENIDNRSGKEFIVDEDLAGVGLQVLGQEVGLLHHHRLQGRLAEPEVPQLLDAEVLLAVVERTVGEHDALVGAAHGPRREI